MGKGSKRKGKKRDKSASSHLDPPHAEGDCLLKEEKESKKEKEDAGEEVDSSDLISFDEIDYESFFEFDDVDQRPSKRRKELPLPEDAKMWSYSKQIEWLSANPSIE